MMYGESVGWCVVWEDGRFWIFDPGRIGEAFH